MFKIVHNENSNGFSKTHFRLTRSVVRTLHGFGHGEPGEGQVSVGGRWSRDGEMAPHHQDQDHKIITATQRFWVALCTVVWAALAKKA